MEFIVAGGQIKKIAWLAAAAFVLLGLTLAAGFWSKKPMLKIAYGNQWKTINPGIQHTLIGDLVIGNQFESLVGQDSSGAIAPLGSTSWSVSKDFKEYVFQIDTSKVFSNGVKLTAQHYKDSWERSALMQPESFNASSQDVLYLIEGFKDLKKTGHISGIIVSSDHQLIIRFIKPYRMALDYLEGNRFAAYIEVDGKFYGTGRYIISEQGPENIGFELNPLTNYDVSDAPKTIDVSVAGGTSGLTKLESGEIDALAYGIGTGLPEKLPSSVGVVVGQDAIRHCLQLNSNPHRIFSSRENRVAFQFIIRKLLRDNPDFLGNQSYSSIDFQIYMELQAGRIPDSEVDQIIESGSQFVKAFVAETQKTPLLVYTPGDTKLQKLLSEYGVKISEKSGVAPGDSYFKLMYTSTEPDVFMSGFSVAYGDPDGIYHKLGRNGAIASAMVVPGKVADLLEAGREITDLNQIVPFYQILNRELLRQAPIVHLGFSKALALYRKDKVRINSTLLKRNEGLLHIYEGI